MNKIHATAPEMLGRQPWPFKDARLAEMLFRYRARNFPATLSLEENRRWQKDRLARLTRPADDRQLDPERFRLEISTARQTYETDRRAQIILDQLEAWADEICTAG